MSIDLNGKTLNTNKFNLNALSADVKIIADGTLIVNYKGTVGLVKVAPDGLVTSDKTTVMVKVDGEDAVVKADIQKAFFNGTGSYIPDLARGAKMWLNSVEYTIYHGQNASKVDIQYGVAMNRVTYLGQEIDTEVLNPQVVSLDADWAIISIESRDVIGTVDKAGTYPNALKMVMNFQSSVDSSIAYIPGTHDIVVDKADASATVDIEDWNYNGTVSSPTYEYDVPGWVGEKPFTTPEPVYTIYNESKIMMFTGVAGLGSLTVGTYYISAFFEETDYANEFETELVEFTVGKAALEVTFESIADGTVLNGTVRTDDDVVTITGTAVYQYDDGANPGYYITIMYTSNTPVTFALEGTYVKGVTYDDSSVTFYLGSLNGRDSEKLFLTATADDLSYTPVTFKIEYGAVFRNTVTGYAEDAADAFNAITAQGITISSTDVAPKTMWIIFDKKGQKNPLDGSVTLGSTNYTEQWNSNTANIDACWYFSFDEKYGQAFKNGMTGDPGKYELKVTSGGAEIVTGNAYVQGAVDAGFKLDMKDALDGIMTGNPDFPNTDVIDKTLWFTWYQGAAYSDIDIVLSKGSESHTESVPAGLGVGFHTFYASFEDQIADLAPHAIGTWTVEVKTGSIIIATGEIKIDSVSSDAALYPAEPGYEVWGKKPVDLQVVTFTVEGLKYTAAGEVYRIGSWIDFWGSAENDKPGYYLMVRMNDTDFVWTDEARVIFGSSSDEMVPATTANGLDGYFVLFLGPTVDSVDDKTFTFKVDYDGDGVFYTEVEYELSMSEIKTSVQPIEYWIGASLDYKYDDYTYSGVFEVSNDKVVAHYTDDVDAENIMNDFARYMGALYRYSDGEVSSVVYQKQIYVWNTAGELKGSNWIHGDLSLVKAVVGAYNDGAYNVTMIISNGLKQAIFTYTAEIEPAPVTYTLTFGDVEMTGLLEGETVYIPMGTADEGSIFVGWNDGTKTYVPGQAYVVTGDVTFEPVYKEIVEEKSAVVIGAGFFEDANDTMLALNVFGSSYTLGVDDRTMFIVFELKGYTAFQGVLMFNGEEVYSESFGNGLSGRVTWLFSDLNPSTLEKMTGKFQNGTYTMVINDMDGNEILSKNVHVVLTPVVEPETFEAVFGDETYTGVAGTQINVPDVPAKDGSNAIGWELDGVVYAPGSVYVVTGDVTFEAVYEKIVEPEKKEYTIVWMNGSEIFAITTVTEGTVPDYTVATPVKAEDKLYTYEFIGWADSNGKAPVAADGAAVYFAQFEAVKKPVEYSDDVEVLLSMRGDHCTIALNSNDGKPIAPGTVKVTYYSYVTLDNGRTRLVSFNFTVDVTNDDASSIVIMTPISDLAYLDTMYNAKATYTGNNSSTSSSSLNPYVPAEVATKN